MTDATGGRAVRGWVAALAAGMFLSVTSITSAAAAPATKPAKPKPAATKPTTKPVAAPAFKPAAAPATRPAGPVTFHDVYRDALAHNRRVLVDAYRSVGKTDPKW